MTNHTKLGGSTLEILKSLLREKCELVNTSPTITDESTYYTLVILRSVEYTSTIQGGYVLLMDSKDISERWDIRITNNTGRLSYIPSGKDELSPEQIYLYSTVGRSRLILEEPRWFNNILLGYPMHSFPTLFNVSLNSNNGITTKTFSISTPTKYDLFNIGLFDEKKDPIHILMVCSSVFALNNDCNYDRAMNILQCSPHSADTSLRLINLFLTALEDRCNDIDVYADRIEYIYTDSQDTDSVYFFANESERLGTDVFSGWFLFFALSELDMFGQGIVGACITHEMNHQLASACRQVIAKLKEPFLCHLYKMWSCHDIILDRKRMLDLNSEEERFLSQFETASTCSFESLQYKYKQLLANIRKMENREASPILTQKHTGNNVLLPTKEYLPSYPLSVANETLIHDTSLSETEYVDPGWPTMYAKNSTFENNKKELTAAISWSDNKKSEFMLLESNMRVNLEYLAQKPFHNYIATKVIPKLDYFKAFIAYQRKITKTYFSTTNVNYIEHSLLDLEYNLEKLDSLTLSQNSGLDIERMKEITVCLLSLSCIIHDLVGELDDCITKTQNIMEPFDLPNLPLLKIPKPTFQDEIRERVSQKNVDPLCIRLLINELCLQATKYNDRELTCLIEKFSSLLYIHMKNEE